MILETARDLISRLEIQDLNPKMVTTGVIRGIDPLIVKNRVVLPITLYEKLTPDDWRPLIASKLAHHRNFDKKKMLVTLSYQLFPFLTIPLFAAALQILGLIPLPQLAADGSILLWVIVMYLVAKVVYAPFFRRLQQTADGKTLELSISPTLESVLKKVEMISPQVSKKSKKIVERRIRDLSESMF